MDVSIIVLLGAGFVAGTAVGGSLALRWARRREDIEETEHLRAVEMRNTPYRDLERRLREGPPVALPTREELLRGYGASPASIKAAGAALRDQPLSFGRRTEPPPQPDYGRRSQAKMLDEARWE